MAARANGWSGLGLGMVCALVLELDVEGDRDRFRELGVWGRESDGPDDGESVCQSNQEAMR